jgi:hypothetical protein
MASSTDIALATTTRHARSHCSCVTHACLLLWLRRIATCCHADVKKAGAKYFGAAECLIEVMS